MSSKSRYFRKLSALLISVYLLSLVACGPPSLDDALKAADKYITSESPSGEWTSGLNYDENAVIVSFVYNNYYLNPNAVSQSDLDWWADLMDTFVDVNQGTKEAMDETGYIADCHFYVYDSRKPNSMMLYVLNGEVSYNYLSNAKDTVISLEKYNSIKMGMTYNEVRNIIGSSGELISAVDLGFGYEYKTEMYVWYASDGIGCATITFQGGVVVAMAQVGLY